MNKSDSLRRLAELVGDLETAGYDVSDLRPDDGSLVDDAGTVASIEVDLPDPLEEVDVADLEVETRDVAVTGDAGIRLSLDVRIAGADATPASSEGGSSGEESPDTTDESGEETVADRDAKSDGEGTDDGDGPTHRDPDRLREVYAEDRTFEEMRDSLGVDVTPDAVRKQMVKHGIHQPDTQESSGDPGGEGDDDPSLEADGGDALRTRTVDEIVDDIGIDRSPSIGDIVRAVHEHRTLRAAQQALDLSDRAETRRLLEALNLLDLFHGRLSTDPEDAVTEDEIEARIRSVAGD